MNILATSFFGKGAFIDLFSLVLVDYWDVRQYQTHIFFGDVAVAVEIIASRTISKKLFTSKSNISA